MIYELFFTYYPFHGEIGLKKEILALKTKNRKINW